LQQQFYFWEHNKKKKNLVTTDRKCVRRGLAYKQLEPFMCVFSRPPVFITEKKITPPKFPILKRKGPLHTQDKKKTSSSSSRPAFLFDNKDSGCDVRHQPKWGKFLFVFYFF
jgi:hypothetical protein